MRYWVKTLFEVGWSSWAFLLSITYRCGCRRRPLFRDRSWTLTVEPSPLPEFSLVECRGGWRVRLGWFELWVVKPGFMRV